MFTTAQLSNFELLLHYLCTTQTLFSNSPPIVTLDTQTDSMLSSEGSIQSVSQFHRSFIEYCIRLKLANLLYYYLDFYRYSWLPLCFFGDDRDKQNIHLHVKSTPLNKAKVSVNNNTIFTESETLL